MHNSFKITQSQTKLPMNPPEFDFSQKSRRKVMIFDENEFQNDQSNHNVFKEVLVREIKDNIDQVKDELMQSFESIMREIKQNSQKKLAEIIKKDEKSDHILLSIENEITGFKDKIQDLSNKIEFFPNKVLENQTNQLDKIKNSDLSTSKLSARLNDLAKKHIKIKSSVEKNKENIPETLQNQIEKKKNIFSNQAQEQSKLIKVSTQINKGFDNKIKLIKDQLSSKIKLTEKKIIGLDDWEKQNKQIEDFSNEFLEKLKNTYFDLRNQIDNFQVVIENLIDRGQAEYIVEQVRIDNMINPLKNELDNLNKCLQMNKIQFEQIKNNTKEKLNQFETYMDNQSNKINKLNTNKTEKIENLSILFQDSLSQIDKIEAFLNSLTQIINKDLENKPNNQLFEEITKEIDCIKSKLNDLESRKSPIENQIEEIFIQKEHFESKLDLITLHFTKLQNQIEIFNQNFFSQIESIHKYPSKPLPLSFEPYPINSSFRKNQSKKIEFPEKNLIFAKKNYNSPCKPELDLPNFGKKEYLSPISHKYQQITHSPVITMNITGNSPFNKSPLWKPKGDNEIPRTSTISRPSNNNRLTDLGFKNCEEIGFRITEEGLIEGADGDILRDNEGKPVKLCQEYLEFLSLN